MLSLLQLVNNTEIIRPGTLRKATRDWGSLGIRSLGTSSSIRLPSLQIVPPCKSKSSYQFEDDFFPIWWPSGGPNELYRVLGIKEMQGRRNLGIRKGRRRRGQGTKSPLGVSSHFISFFSFSWFWLFLSFSSLESSFPAFYLHSICFLTLLLLLCYLCWTCWIIFLSVI